MPGGLLKTGQAKAAPGDLGFLQVLHCATI